MVNVNNLHSASSLPKYDMATMTLARVDEEIARRKSDLLIFYSQRNSFSVIFRLPTETLQAIFVLLARDYYSRDKVVLTSTVPSWVNISYVCRHWRNIALTCPSLWTFLFITSPRWTEELLSRSKQAPLKLRVSTRDWDKGTPRSRSVEQVMNHVERIQEFHLHLPFTFRDHQVFSKLASRAPRLQNLTISATGVLQQWEWSSVLFDGDTPALRTLELSFCPVSWYSLKLSGLTTLSLRHIPSRFQQNTVDLLATLRCMQDLTVLYLDHVLASAASFLSSAAFQTFQKINLPHLSRLWITAPLSTVIALLHCVNIPLKTEVRLECNFERGSSLDDYAQLSSLLAQRFDTSDDQAPITRSLVARFQWGMVTLTFSVSERDRNSSVLLPYVEWGCNVPLQVVIKFDESTRTSNDWSDGDCIISNICCSIPLTNVRSLHVFDPPFASAFWRRTFGHLPNLRYLKMSRGYLPDLASVLSLSRHDRTENEGGYTARGSPDCVFAPALEELELCEISFKCSTPVEGGVPPFADVQPLYDALSGRQDSRGQLTMEHCVAVANGHVVELDMLGRWEDGHFRVVEECSLPYYESELEGSDSSDLPEDD